MTIKESTGGQVPWLAGRKLPILAAIVLNAVPIFGVVFWGWSAFALIFLYWLENVLIGVRNVGSMLLSGAAQGPANFATSLFYAAFFTIHYGGFCFGHGIFVVTLFGSGLTGGPNYIGEGVTPFDLITVTKVLFAAAPSLASGLISIAIWQVVQFVLFVMRGEFRTATVQDLMGAPYPRILVLHFTILGAGFLLMKLGAPMAGLVLLALFKTAYDVRSIQKSDKASPVTASTAPTQ